MWKPEEILAAPRDMVFAFVAGFYPIVARLTPYYSDLWYRPRDFRDRMSTLLRAVLFGIAMCGLAWLLTAVAKECRTVEKLNYLIHSIQKGRR
jgi:hypothetical protein